MRDQQLASPPTCWIVAAACAVSAGCASSSSNQRSEEFAIVAHTGRIESRIEIPSTPGSTVYVPVFVGPLVVSIPKEGRFGGEGFFIYDISVQGREPLVKVASRGEIPNGTCVDVLVRKVEPGVTSFPVRDAILRLSKACGVP